MTPIATFELPLEHAPLLNTYARMHWAKRAKLKQQITMRVMSQIGRRLEPLPGRPRVVAVRYSSVRPDQDGAWSKAWLDVLKVKKGLGWIVDDSDAHIATDFRWEKAPPKEGKVVVELYEEAA
jgi:hypothetical protein